MLRRRISKRNRTLSGTRRLCRNSQTSLSLKVPRSRLPSESETGDDCSLTSKNPSVPNRWCQVGNDPRDEVPDVPPMSYPSRVTNSRGKSGFPLKVLFPLPLSRPSSGTSTTPLPSLLREPERRKSREVWGSSPWRDPTLKGKLQTSFLTSSTSGPSTPEKKTETVIYRYT